MTQIQNTYAIYNNDVIDDDGLSEDNKYRGRGVELVESTNPWFESEHMTVSNNVQPMQIIDVEDDNNDDKNNNNLTSQQNIILILCIFMLLFLIYMY